MSVTVCLGRHHWHPFVDVDRHSNGTVNDTAQGLDKGKSKQPVKTWKAQRTLEGAYAAGERNAGRASARASPTIS